MKNHHDHQNRATWNLGANGPGISSSVSKWLLVVSRATLGWWGVGELSSWIASELWWGGSVPLVEGEGKLPLLITGRGSLWSASCLSWEEKNPRLISSLGGRDIWEELPLIWVDITVKIMMMMEVKTTWLWKCLSGQVESDSREEDFLCCCSLEPPPHTWWGACWQLFVVWWG